MRQLTEKKERYYFAVTNSYSTASSLGFSNTWKVLAFTNKTDRDNFVLSSNKLATKSIRKSEIGKYIEAPKPFSGQAFCICISAETSNDFYLVEACYPEESRAIARVF